MKKILATSLVVLLIGLVSLSAIRPAQAGITGTPTWIKPAWKDRTGVSKDPFLGDVNVAYIAGSKWILNIWVHNDATNMTHAPPPASNEKMDAMVYRIAVWFDWNKFYNTTLDVTLKYDTDYLFTVNGTMEQTAIASNLFTHSYKVYVEYEITYQAGGGTITAKKTWEPYSGSGFAVISQDQYSSADASKNYTDFEDMVDGYVDDYAESYNLYIQAEREAKMGAMSYSGGEFSSALQHYNTALDLLNQSWTKYTTIKAEDDSVTLDKKQAELDAIKANTTATLVHANAVATATVINAVAFAFFGIGFIFFGIAAIFYARRPKPTQ
jgi:hypothetical protein